MQQKHSDRIAEFLKLRTHLTGGTGEAIMRRNMIEQGLSDKDQQYQRNS